MAVAGSDGGDAAVDVDGGTASESFRIGMSDEVALVAEEESVAEHNVRDTQMSVA